MQGVIRSQVPCDFRISMKLEGKPRSTKSHSGPYTYPAAPMDHSQGKWCYPRIFAEFFGVGCWNLWFCVRQLGVLNLAA